MSRYYPLSLNLTGRLCVVIGGGEVAERKVIGLLDAEARVRVISLTLTPALQTLADTQQIEALLVPYESDRLIHACLVFAATNRREVNARIAADAEARSLLVNIADSPEESGFVVPSVVRRGDFCLAISTGGNNPMLAARVGEELKARYGPEYGAYVELLGQMRDYIKMATDVPERRRAAHRCLLDAEAELLMFIRSGQEDAARAKAESLVSLTLGRHIVPGP